ALGRVSTGARPASRPSADAAVPAALLAGTVVLPIRSLVQDELGERTRIVWVPHGVHDLARRGKERPRCRTQCVIALADPAKSVARFAGARGLADRLAVREPRQVDAARDRQPDPFPDARIDVEKEMLLSRWVPDELDLADAVVAERLEDRASPLDDFRDLLADDEATGSKAFGVLLELPPDEGSANLAVRRNVRAERVEAACGHVDDLLGDAREVGRFAREPDQIGSVLGPEYLHPEAVVETTLLRRLDDRRIADLSRRRLRVVERERLRDRDMEMVRVRVKPPLIEDGLDNR